MKSASTRVERVELKALTRLPGVNPNVMSEHDFAALKSAINHGDIGYLQPILVAEHPDGTLVLLDGEHRVRALLESGYTHADAVVGPATSERLLRLSLHIRGDHDPNLLAAELQALAAVGVDLEAMTEVTPFEASELQELLRLDIPMLDLGMDLSKATAPAALSDGVPATSDRVEETALPDESTFNLTLRFHSKTDRDRVSQTLRQHGITPEDGALTLLGLK